MIILQIMNSSKNNNKQEKLNNRRNNLKNNKNLIFLKMIFNKCLCILKKLLIKYN